MYKATIKNAAGETLVLTEQESRWQIISITGLSPVKTQINTTTAAYLDGAQYNSSRLDSRNIVIKLRLNGDVEANRIELYKYFRNNQPCVFGYKTSTRDVIARGYVESVECDLFSASEIMQLSIICPSSYFEAAQTTTVTLGTVSVPAEIENTSDVPVGFTASVAVSNTGAVTRLIVGNSSTGKKIQLDGTPIGSTFSIDISTMPGQKSIDRTIGGTTANYLSALSSDSSLFLLEPGINEVYCSVDTVATVTATLTYALQYRGV